MREDAMLTNYCSSCTIIACDRENLWFPSDSIRASFGCGQAVRQWTLDPRSQVRILAPEPATLLSNMGSSGLVGHITQARETSGARAETIVATSTVISPRK